MMTRKNALRPRLTREFMETLIECFRVVGDSSDPYELWDFIQNIEEISGNKLIGCRPYDDDDFRPYGPGGE